MAEALTLGSLFDGSGGFPLGGIMCGIRPLWASEIEPFPIMVTTRQLPFMEHLGDITDVRGGEIAPVDIITFGSPCQDMSIAGRRDGLGGSRSGLFFEAVRVIREMREATDGRYPRYIVWENVTGAFSSNKGEDFRSVLEEIVRIKEAEADIPRYEKWPSAGQILADSFSLAWRVLDAQYWGVPQRRKRIYLVADLDGGRAGRILFESEGLSGYSAEGFRAWKRAAGSAEGGVGEADLICLNDQGGQRMEVTEEITSTLRAQAHHPPCVMSAGFCTEHSEKSRSIGYEEEKSPTLRAGVVPAAMLFDNHSQDCRYTGPVEKAQAVVARYGTGGNNQSLVLGTPRTLKIRCGKEGGGKGPLIQDDLSATLAVSNDQTLFQPKAVALNCRNGTASEEVSGTLQAKSTGGHSLNYINPVFSSSKASFFTDAAEDVANTLVATDYKDPPLVNGPEYIVRRLTPTECARLQGFPDWWTEGLGTAEPSEEDIRKWTEIFETYRKASGSTAKPKTENQIVRWLKDPYSDSAAYKLWGNGVALPCVWFVLSGIVYFDQSEG